MSNRLTGLRLLRRPEVERLTGLSRASIYARMAAGTFPCPVRLGSNSVAWRLHDVENWIEALPTAKLDESRAAGG